MVGVGRAVASRVGAAVADASSELRAAKVPATATRSGEIVNKSTKLKYLMVHDSVH
jgi:hypothetical protein